MEKLDLFLIVESVEFLTSNIEPWIGWQQ